MSTTTGVNEAHKGFDVQKAAMDGGKVLADAGKAFSSFLGRTWTFFNTQYTEHKDEVSQAAKNGYKEAHGFLETHGDRINLISKIWNAIQFPFFLIGMGVGYFMTKPESKVTQTAGKEQIEASKSLTERFADTSKKRGLLGMGMVLSSFVLPGISALASGALAMNDFKHMVHNNATIQAKLNTAGNMASSLVDNGVQITGTKGK